MHTLFLKCYMVPHIYCILYDGKENALDITESVSELKQLLIKQKTLKREKRIECLLDIKNNKFDTRQDLADYMGIHIRTLEKWLNCYKSGGVAEMLEEKAKNKQSKIVTPAIHKGLEQKVNDPHNPFLGYWDAQNWVKEIHPQDAEW